MIGRAVFKTWSIVECEHHSTVLASCHQYTVSLLGMESSDDGSNNDSTYRRLDYGKGQETKEDPN